MILVVSTPTDEHALAVLAELSKLGAQAQILDLSEFPQQFGLALRYHQGERDFSFGCKEGGLDLENCGAVWWRRPQVPQISSEITRPSHRDFAMNECQEALAGLWHALDAFWVNDPARDQIAHRKIYQLRIAQDVELEVPETLVTSCSRAAREFIQTHNEEQVIYKSFSATEQEWRETRLLKKEEADLLGNVRFAPVIFQDYVEAVCDLRVTLVGDEVFAVAIHSQETSYKVDFRMDIGNARIETTSLPESVEERLRALMHRMGLVYGAIDMRLTPDGRYVFLEVNPAGQWLFVERPSGQPIASALARLLYQHDR